MIKNKSITVRKRGTQYTTKLTYWKEEPGKPRVEMNANFFGATKEEVEDKVREFIAGQEK